MLMKRILLIGQIGEITRSINDGLSDAYRVQMCSEDMDLIRSMEKATNPNLIIFCQIGVEEVDKAFFLWVKKYRPYIPVVVIATPEKWYTIESLCDTDQFTRLIRPVTIGTIEETCEGILNGNELSLDDEFIDEDYTPPVQTGKKRVRILVVDDSPLFLRSMKSMLEDRYEVILANSGKKALEQIPKKRPDLVLMDYEMGEMSGKETFEAMLQDDGMKEIPVVFLTSVSTREKVFGVLEHMPAGYVLKPVDKKFLYEEIQRVTDYV